MHADADAAEQLQVFTEGKSLHPVHYRPPAQVGGSLVDVEHRRAGERHVQPGMVVVDEFQLFGPVGVFVDFVDEQDRRFGVEEFLLAGRFQHLAHLLDARRDGRQGVERAFESRGNDLGQRSFFPRPADPRG